MEHFDDRESASRIPLFQAAAILIVVIALLGVLADRFMSSGEEADANVELTSAGGAVAAGAQEAATRSPLSEALLVHWQALLPTIEELQRAWEARDVEALRQSHDDLVRSIEAIPMVPVGASETDRAFRDSYREALVYLEDGVDDLREGLEIPNPAEWEEGMLDVRTARVRLDAVVQRIQSGQ